MASFLASKRFLIFLFIHTILHAYANPHTSYNINGQNENSHLYIIHHMHLFVFFRCIACYFFKGFRKIILILKTHQTGNLFNLAIV